VIWRFFEKKLQNITLVAPENITMLLYVFDKLLELSTLAIVWNIESLLVVFAHSLVDSVELDGKKENKFPVGPSSQ